MRSPPDRFVQRWLEAGLIDARTAERIRAWELEHEAPGAQHRFAAVAFGLGGLLLMAGVFLFVSAHWADLGPAARFSLVLAAVASFHVGGALSATAMPHLSTSLHATGTAAFGGGIFLCGQIFNMAEHWPGALLLWGLGAALSLYLLRDWPHVLWLAVLVPAWLWGEWIDALPPALYWHYDRIPAIGTVLLLLAYMGANRRDRESTLRRALSWLGIAALIPACMFLGTAGAESSPIAVAVPNGGPLREILGWVVALLLPIGLSVALRGKQALYLGFAVVWAFLVAATNWHSIQGELALYGLYAVGAVGIVAWGIKERLREPVNAGVIGFALTICGFYFSTIFDQLGRSLGLIGIGLLFLGGGWLMERLRRRLLAHMDDRAP